MKTACSDTKTSTMTGKTPAIWVQAIRSPRCSKSCRRVSRLKFPASIRSSIKKQLSPSRLQATARYCISKSVTRSRKATRAGYSKCRCSIWPEVLVKRVRTSASSAVASFGMILRDYRTKENSTLDAVLQTAENSRGADVAGYREEFVELVGKARDLKSAP